METGRGRRRLEKVRLPPHGSGKSMHVSPRLAVPRLACCAASSAPRLLSAQLHKSIVVGIIPIHAACNSNLGSKYEQNETLKRLRCAP